MTNKKHNDPLEEFFKKKVREYDITYKEEDWLKLEKRLDAVEANNYQKSYWKRYFAAAAVILLLSILAYFTYQQQQRIDELNEQLTQREQPPSPQSSSNEILPEGLFDFSSPSSRSDTQSTDKINLEQSSGNIADNSSKSNNAKSDRGSNKDTKQDFALLNSNQKLITLAQLSDQPLLSSGEIGHNNETLVFNANKLTPPTTTDQSITTSIAPNLNNSTAFNTKNQLPERETPRLSVGLMGGPDLSTVGGISNFYDPGYKIGLSVEYNISKNLAISVGAIHSNVQYTASGNDYNPPEEYWSYGNLPSKTVGKCLLIDIPVSLKYNILHFNHSRLFVTGGISSYIMLNEDYQFEYNGYTSSQQQRWQEKTGTRHWMSNTVFSLGYEMDLRRHISLRVEPFIKVPVREVGWANVKLYSMGSFISVNYNIF